MSPHNAFANLRRFVSARAALSRCELCSRVLASDHEHLVELAKARLLCACQPCAVLFSNQDGGKYRRVPQRIVSLKQFQLTDAQWAALEIPIGLAFFFRNSVADKVIAAYPSPAGPVESLVSGECWQEIEAANPALATMQPDVEALLTNRLNSSQKGTHHYLVPMDECYRLVGLIRAHWQGMSGGTAVWQEIERYFNGLKARAAALE